MEANYPGYKPKKKIEKNSRGKVHSLSNRIRAQTNRKNDFRERQFRNGG